MEQNLLNNYSSYQALHQQGNPSPKKTPKLVPEKKFSMQKKSFHEDTEQLMTNEEISNNNLLHSKEHKGLGNKTMKSEGINLNNLNR